MSKKGGGGGMGYVNGDEMIVVVVVKTGKETSYVELVYCFLACHCVLS